MKPGQNGRPMTPEGYIGSFNSNDREDIAEIKQKAKDLILAIQRLENSDNRRKAIAITHIEEATMMAVKSIFS